MTPTFNRKLPGIAFPEETPTVEEALPRMDIAAFVGFADTGPLDTPTPVEDMAAFRQIFGADVPLTWDPGAGQTVYSQLGPAVEAFFKNGGKRCWVVRIGIESDSSPDPGERKEFNSGLFLDPDLAEVGVNALLGEANHKLYINGEALHGIHSLLPIEEVTLVAVPDASQPGWKSKSHLPPQTLDAPVLHLEAAALRLEWSNLELNALYTLQESADSLFQEVVTLYRGKDTHFTVEPRRPCPGCYFYRVNARAEERVSPWSNTVSAVLPALDFEDCRMREIEEPGLPAATPGASNVYDVWTPLPPGDYETDARGELLKVHRALLRFCAARGDMFAVLDLPRHYTKADAVLYKNNLVDSFGESESQVPSFGALYYPWTYMSIDSGFGTSSGDLRYVPPGGGVCGVMAARAIRRGAWIAPANEALMGVIALQTFIQTKAWQELFYSQVNVIRQSPRGFILLSADTLSGDKALRPINVRRLLILLRRLALREGMTYVFEPNNKDFHRRVQYRFEQFLARLYSRGAFAGDRPETSYQVVTDSSVNIAASLDQGRFIIELRVAPSLPMTFITVRLVQTQNEGLAILEI